MDDFENAAPARVDVPSAIVDKHVHDFRLKLLSLTTLNPLISFKHSARTPRYVRVIDELPDQLYSRWLSGDELRFKSLGLPPDDPQDEKTVLFQRALEAAKFEDEEYQRELAALGPDPGELAIARIELTLRARLRERLGMPPKPVASPASPADAAQQRGLNPSFDLPSAPQGGAADSKHADKDIQTLLFETDLDTVLRRIREAARLSISESGVNPLYCVFGFLEYYDSETAPPLHAPLLLQQLDPFQRKAFRGRFQYTVTKFGDAPEINVALAEKLKQFNLELPSFEYGDTPEKYLLKVQSMIEQKRGWRVRRWVTIGLFSFAKIAMYKDLGSSEWESVGGLARHSVLQRLLDGNSDQPADFGVIDEEADIGGDATRFGRLDRELRIPLITDADSSQLTAIEDVLGGRNLVIEGPPGTGKSQTITNLIAAAMAEGKSVLFVAEKMAALNVVRDRLAVSGLGDFCLELHSTKAGRKEVAAALDKRLKREAGKPARYELEATLKKLAELRDKLARCVEALAHPAGKLGIPIQELIWKSHAVRSQTAEMPSELDGFTLDSALEWTRIELGHLRTTAERYERARRRVADSHGSVSAHPWNGVARADINPNHAQMIVMHVTRLARASEAAVELFDQLATLTAFNANVHRDLEQLASATIVSPPAESASDDLIARLADPNTLAVTRDFLNNLNRYVAAHASVTPAFVDTNAANGCDPESLQSLVSSAATAASANQRIGDLPKLKQTRVAQAQAWRAISELMNAIAQRLGLSADRTPAVEAALFATVELAHGGLQFAPARRAAVLRTGASASLRDMRDRASQLLAGRTELEEQFDLAAVPESASLREQAKVLSQGGLFAFLNSNFRHARRTHLGVCRQPAKVSKLVAAKALDQIAAQLEAERAFADEPRCRELLDSANGIRADIEGAFRQAEWADRVRAAFPAGDSASDRLRTFLFEADPDRIEAVAAFQNHAQRENLAKVLATGSKTTVETRANAYATSADAIQRLIDGATRFKLRSEFATSELAGLAAELRTMRSLQSEIESSESARSLLGSRFAGADTAREPIAACIRYVDDVHAADINPVLGQWLLQAESRRRHAALSSLASAAKATLSEFDAALAALDGATAIDYRQWIKHENAADIRLIDLRDHARICVNEGESSLNMLIDEARERADVAALGLQPMLDVFEQKKAPLDRLGLAAERVALHSIVRLCLVDHPVLANFRGDPHESTRSEFKRLDLELQKLRRADIADRISGRTIPRGIGVGPKSEWTDLALVQNWVSQAAKQLSIRDLLDRSGTAIREMMPCFMMSPLSIAQYLKPGKLQFDLVVMDEASQLRPEDAVGAVARGGQVVIVGDPKQLPPTNFFQLTGDGGGDGDGDGATDGNADETSILDKSLGMSLGKRTLNWHYRSRDPSLIQFSNKEFYNNELILFPAAHHQRPDFGVQYEYVADGEYRTSINMPEVRAVAKAVLKYVARHPSRSLGVVALNQKQAERIGLEIESLGAIDPVFLEWQQRYEDTLEPFFVKNLENVQGDERDAIFISTVYGPSEPGKREFPQRFGPINNKGGHRRLNVLFTRAKYHMVTFSSMDPADIHAEENSPWGVRALKGYLNFAKTRRLELAGGDGGEPDSDFERSVADALSGHGYEVRTQVGVMGYRIDLAVRHPDRPGSYALGIECDGEMYHSSKSARDRDRLRQTILENLGWRIHRIWSLDWYRRNKDERERLLRAVAEAINLSPTV